MKPIGIEVGALIIAVGAALSIQIVHAGDGGIYVNGLIYRNSRSGARTTLRANQLSTPSATWDTNS